MPDRPKVLHLIDDTTAGGVMRVLDFIQTAPGMAEIAEHHTRTMERGRMSFRTQSCDVIVSHLTISWRGLPALIALRLANPKARLIHIEHSYTEGFVRHTVPSPLRFYTLLRLAYGMFDTVVAVSRGQYSWLQDQRLCPRGRLALIRSCVDFTAFAKLCPPPPGKVIAAIGRLEPQKGFDTLIRAFRQAVSDGAELHIIGQGSELEHLQRLAHGDTRIQFKGFASDPRQAFDMANIVAMPSRWEAYGLVALEALCAGRHVLCSAVDGLSDHAEHGAIVSESDTIDTWSAMLTDALSNETQMAHPDRVNLAHTLENAFVESWRRVLTPTIETALGTDRPQYKMQATQS